MLLEAQHGGIQVQYLGMLAQAQTRATKVRSIQAGIALATQIGQADPISLHVIDFDQAQREALDATGFPASCLRDPRDVAKIRDMANKQAQQQQQIENAPKIAKAAALAGKGAEQDSPLKMLLGGGKEPGE
jgi:hypothetical protein